MSVGDGQAVAASIPEAEPAALELTVTAAWNLLHQARASFTSLETRAAIIAPSVVGGLGRVHRREDLSRGPGSLSRFSGRRVTLSA